MYVCVCVHMHTCVYMHTERRYFLHISDKSAAMVSQATAITHPSMLNFQKVSELRGTDCKLPVKRFGSVPPNRSSPPILPDSFLCVCVCVCMCVCVCVCV